MTIESNREMATITVLIPTFNRREMLRRAIESVRSETRVPLRIVVFDNASKDGTDELVNGLALIDSRISLVRHDENVGGLHNHILAMSSLATEYFAILADDDFHLPDFLYESYQLLQSDLRLGAAVYVSEARDESGRVVMTFPASLDTIRFGRLSPAEHMRDWLANSHYCWTSIVWRCDVLQTVGKPYFHAGLPSDVDFQARVFAAWDVHLVRRSGAVYNLHAGQASLGLSIADIESWATIFDQIDRDIGRRALIPPHEYAVLRATLWRRVRFVWHLGADDLDPALAARYVAVAALRLGDWPLALQLAERAETGRSGSRYFAAPSLSDLPPEGFQLGSRVMMICEFVRAFGRSATELRDLGNTYAAACVWGVAAEERIVAATTDARLARDEIAVWQHKAEQAELRFERLWRKPLVQVLARLRLITRPGCAREWSPKPKGAEWDHR